MEKQRQFMFALIMIAFGSIGVFIKPLNLSSAYIVFMRFFIGSIFLFLLVTVKHIKLDFKAIKQNLVLLFICGTCLGTECALLVEGYKRAGVGTATLIYYFAPVLVFLLSPLIFKEKLTFLKTLGITLALIGLIIINGIALKGSVTFFDMLICIMSAITYTIALISNKLLKNISGLDGSIFQLTIAAFVMFIYLVITKQPILVAISFKELINLLIIGIFHTGLCFYMYFSLLYKLKTQTVSILSYLDPLSSVIFAAVFLSEAMGFWQIIGATLIILGSALPTIIEKNKSIA